MVTITTSAAVLTGVGQVELRDMEMAEPGDGEVLLRVSAVGLCGSDAHWFEEGSIGDAGLGDGLVLGHEFCGVIESGMRAGDRVVVDPAIPCGGCTQCARARPNLCLEMRFAGHGSTHGALRQRLVWRERGLVSLPDEMPDDVGALLEPLGVAIHAVDLADIDESMTIGVIGSGPIGLLLLIVLQERGVTRLTATDLLAHRRDAAQSLGVNAESPSIDGSEARFDVVFDAAGTDSALAGALDAVLPGGRVVVVGIPPNDRTSLRASMARRKELTAQWCRRMDPGDLTRAMAIAAGRIETMSGLVTHRYRLPAVARAFDDLVARSGIKVLVTP